jgi:hypothetical protein
MAAVTKSGTPSVSTPVPGYEHKLPSGFYAGEAIGAGDACYIKTSDGKIYKSTGAAANAAAVVDGFAFQAYAADDPVTLLWDVNFNYGAGLSPGTFLYLSGTTAGGLDTATSTGGTVPIARVVDATRIYVMKSY